MSYESTTGKEESKKETSHSVPIFIREGDNRGTIIVFMGFSTIHPSTIYSGKHKPKPYLRFTKTPNRDPQTQTLHSRFKNPNLKIINPSPFSNSQANSTLDSSHLHQRREMEPSSYVTVHQQQYITTRRQPYQQTLNISKQTTQPKSNFIQQASDNQRANNTEQHKSKNISIRLSGKMIRKHSWSKN